VGEEDAPVVAEPVVEADLPLRALGLEVGCGVADLHLPCLLSMESAVRSAFSSDVLRIAARLRRAD
jgi:hypothetical protein